jgi:hypothetical protein
MQPEHKRWRFKVNKELVGTYGVATLAAVLVYASQEHLGLTALVFFATLGAIITGWLIGDEIKREIDERLRARYAPKNEPKKSEVW